MKEATDKPRPSRLRRLSDEEIALWVEVAKSVAKRRGASLPTPASSSSARAAAAGVDGARRHRRRRGRASRRGRRPSRRWSAG